MFLESIRMFGFKSFAGKVDVKLDEGITGVLGPNGCGKSNIADAVRWVLGEQSVKQLRGASMEDVIFKGTRDKKPMSLAEVTLKIRNQSGRLPVEFSEVSVGRRLYRSGDSEYLLNRTPCRLKDLKSMFLDSGLGVQAYAIFERQMIDDILNDNGARRRELFEEASGIMKYKVRRKEATRKLDAANRDLERLSDLIGEIEREVRSLSRQVGRARRYRRLKEDCRGLDVAVSARRVATIAARERELRGALEEARSRDARVSAELRGGEAEVEKLRLQLVQVGESLGRARQDLAQRREDVAAKRQRSEVLAERREGLKRSVESLTEEVAFERVRRETLTEEQQSADEEGDRLLTTVREQEVVLRREESDLTDLETMLREKRTQQAELQQLTLDLREEASQKRHELARERMRLEELARRRERLETDRDEIATRTARLEERLTERREDLLRKDAGLDASRGSIAELEERRRAEAETLESTLERGRDATRERASITSRLETLDELRRSYEGFDSGVRALLLSPRDGVIGPLAELVHVDEGLGAALEAALGGTLQAVVVRDADVALACIESLSREEQGRVTFCPVREMSAGAPERPHAPGTCLADVTEIHNPEIAPVVSALLGRVFVVDTAAQARAHSREHRDITWVTRNGDAFHDDRRVSGGSPSLGRKLIMRETEISRLTDKLASIDETRRAIEVEVESLTATLEDLDRQRDERAALLREEEQARGETEQAIRHLEFELGLTRDEARGVDTELMTLNQETGEVRGHIGDWEAACEQAASEGEAHAGQWEELNAELEALEGRREEKQRSVGDLRVQFAEVSAELRSQQARRERINADRTESERVGAEKQQRILDAETQTIEIQEELALLRETLTGSDATIESVAQRVDALSSEESECRNAWAEQDEALAGLRRQVEELRETAHEIDLELSSLTGEVTRLRERLFEDYHVELVERTDAAGIPMYVRHERRRVAGPSDDPDDPDGAEPGAEDVSSNGHGRLEEPGLGHAEPLGVGNGDGHDPEVELEPVRVEEVIISDPMPADPPPRHAKLEEAEWAELVGQLRQKLADFGPVNEMAVEDYDERKERLDFLTTQRDDLIQARNELLETIRKVNREARERFQATFAAAQENFKRLHEILFPGGHAELRLEGEDPLEGDIVMVARPRGKRIESIKLLSSGERALTAIALIFAVYMIKPSPFCILDEVDAPLDDANIDRFVRLIKEFADKTQFIVITHNKRTMEACDSLYGVTMEEAGVSKLVSVRFHEGDVVMDGVARPDLVPG